MKVAVKEDKGRKIILSLWTFFSLYLSPHLQSIKVMRSIQKAHVQIPGLSLSANNSDLN